MSDKRANMLINEILSKDAQTAGAFMSLLAYNYIKLCGISKKQFIKSLKNSLKILEKDER